MGLRPATTAPDSETDLALGGDEDGRGGRVHRCAYSAFNLPEAARDSVSSPYFGPKRLSDAEPEAAETPAARRIGFLGVGLLEARPQILRGHDGGQSDVCLRALEERLDGRRDLGRVLHVEDDEHRPLAFSGKK
jgi:hypothetical protein